MPLVVNLGGNTVTKSKILRTSEVLERTGMTRTTWYRLCRTDPTFPRRIQLGPRCVGFFEHEVDAWISSVTEQRQ